MATDQRISVPIGAGAVAGALAWLVGYGVAYAFGHEAVRSDLRMQLLGLIADEPTVWRVVGWVYYNAHAVDVEFPAVGPFSASRSNYVLSDASLHLFLLLPPLLLVIAGAAVAWITRSGVRNPSTGAPRASDSALAGATVVLGYFAVTVAGLVVFATSIDGSTIRPHPVTAVVLAGVLYPAVFGGTGGLIAWLLRRSA